MTGLSASEIINKSVKEVLPGIEKSNFDWIGEYGRRFTGEITSSVYYNKEGEPRTNMIIRDVSERAIAEDPHMVYDLDETG